MKRSCENCLICAVKKDTITLTKALCKISLIQPCTIFPVRSTFSLIQVILKHSAVLHLTGGIVELTLSIVHIFIKLPIIHHLLVFIIQGSFSGDIAFFYLALICDIA